MRREEIYQNRIRAYDNATLRLLWQQIRDGESTGFPPGKGLEYLILRAFEIEGAEVIWPYEVPPGSSTLEQIDGVIYVDGLHCLIEAKDYAAPVDVEPIAKLRNQLARRPSSSLAILFAKNGFTDPAKTLASYLAPQMVILWTGAELRFALENAPMRSGLQQKFRYCVENGMSYYDLVPSED